MNDCDFIKVDCVKVLQAAEEYQRNIYEGRRKEIERMLHADGFTSANVTNENGRYFVCGVEITPSQRLHDIVRYHKPIGKRRYEVVGAIYSKLVFATAIVEHTKACEPYTTIFGRKKNRFEVYNDSGEW